MSSTSKFKKEIESKCFKFIILGDGIIFCFFQLIFSTLSLLCFSFPIYNLSVLFLFVNNLEKTKKNQYGQYLLARTGEDL
jgi:hypothetical protein